MATNIQEVHLNDFGTIFRTIINDCDSEGVQSPLDISSASTAQLIFRSPSGAVATQNGIFTTDGTDGGLEHITAEGDINEVGIWKLQAYIVLTSGSWRSDLAIFEVYENL